MSPNKRKYENTAHRIHALTPFFLIFSCIIQFSTWYICTYADTEHMLWPYVRDRYSEAKPENRAILTSPFERKGELTGLSINSHTGMYGALGCGRMIGQPAADNHYTTSLSRQARKPVVHPPWNGYIYSNEKRRFSLHTFFCRPTKESMSKKIRCQRQHDSDVWHGKTV